MALHPQAKELLDMMAQMGIADFADLTPEEARAQMAAMRQEVEKPDVKGVTDRTIPVSDGEIPVRIYTPDAQGALPALVFYHGGGWVLGDLEYSDLSCRMLANDVGCVVVSVDYRLAPEYKFPTPLNDCYDAFKWVVDNAGGLGVDPQRVAVGGDSAGGNLAAAVAIRARDENGPKVAHQLLIYPVTDRDFETQSYKDNGDGYLLTRSAMEWFWNHYITSPADAEKAIASPLRVSDASGLAPATVITAEYDPLRDEGEAFAKKLRDAGVPVVDKRYDGQIHGFFHMSAVLDDGKDAVAFAGEQLKKALAPVAA